MDQVILEGVVTALRHNPRLRSSSLVVEVRGASVSLRGLVPDLTARLAAVADVWRVPGVRSVRHHELAIRPGSDDNDGAISDSPV
jgi:osmotically-inducible protein OsmY